jgi:membrane protease YdiL (CAAX protease family)
VRHLTGRLGSSMVTHALFNAAAVLLLALTASL